MSFIADSPDYSPTLLRGRLTWKRPLGEGFQSGIYRLVSLRAGTHVIEVQGRQLEVTAGNTYFVPPGNWRVIDATRGASAMLLAFTVAHCELKRTYGNAWDPVSNQHKQPSPEDVWGIALPNLMDDKIATSIDTILPLICSIWWRDRWQHYRANSLLRDLLDRIIHHYREETTPKAHVPVADTWLDQVLQLIDQRLSTIQTTQDLAAAFGMGRDHFTRRFRSEHGDSPSVYLKKRRLSEAALLLRKTSWSINIISAHVGYPSRGAFHQAWRKVYAVSPTTWRRDLH